MSKINPEKVVPKEFTITSFLNNPTGDLGTNAVARKLVLEQYSNQLNALIKAGKKPVVTMVHAGQSVFAKVEIPSESFDNFGYEVVIEFVDVDLTKTTLLQNNIRFFSNSPSFTFSFAHVFDLFSLLSEPFKKKYSERVFAELPDMRNPDFQTFYEKSITMALLWIRENGLLSITDNKSKYRKMPLGKVSTIVLSSDTKVEEYSKLRKEQSELKKKAKAADKLKRDAEKKANKPAPSFSVDKTVADRKTDNKITNRKVESKLDNKLNNKLDRKVNNRVDNKVKRKVK